MTCILLVTSLVTTSHAADSDDANDGDGDTEVSTEMDEEIAALHR